jgi:hypothetical protein
MTDRTCLSPKRCLGPLALPGPRWHRCKPGDRAAARALVTPAGRVEPRAWRRHQRAAHGLGVAGHLCRKPAPDACLGRAAGSPSGQFGEMEALILQIGLANTWPRSRAASR